MEIPARKSLDLAGDGDEIELVKRLESVFDVEFRGEELERARTVGDLEAILAGRFADADGARCMSAMAFYRLRRFLRSHDAARHIAPHDRIADFFPDPAAFAEALRRETGLRFEYPAGLFGGVGVMLQLCWLAALAACLTGHGTAALIAATFAATGVAMIRTDSGRFADRQSVGDVARELVTQNFGLLARDGGRAGRPVIWEVMRTVIADLHGLRAAEIGRDTLLIAPSNFVFSRG